MNSDEYNCTISNPYDSSEVETVAKAIYEYILEPDAPELREIVLNGDCELKWRSIDYNTFAEMHSENMLYLNPSKEFVSLNHEDLRCYLKRFFVGILFRYAYCVQSDLAAFEVSFILEYIEGVSVLFSKEHREDELYNALLTTLRALHSLEPRYRMGQKVTEFMNEKDKMNDKNVGQSGTP